MAGFAADQREERRGSRLAFERAGFDGLFAMPHENADNFVPLREQ
jgi:hypothetical protein